MLCRKPREHSKNDKGISQENKYQTEGISRGQMQVMLVKNDEVQAWTVNQKCIRNPGPILKK